jgi:hypothetical protein
MAGNRVGNFALGHQTTQLRFRCGSFSTEAANSAARSTSASPRKLTSGPYETLVAMGQQGTWLWSWQSLVYPPALHDNLKVLGGFGDQFDILQRVALDQQQIGKRALFHDAELPCIRTTLAGQCK